MPARSKITGLPDEIKAALNHRLVRTGFCNYDEIAKWLREQGFEISRSAVHRYGQNFEDRLSAIRIATEQAKAVAEVVKDDEGAMNEALISLVQEKAFDVLINLQNEDQEEFRKIFPKMGIMVSKLSKASVDQKKFAAETRKKALAEAADAVEATARKEGVSPETIKKIRRDVLMMAQ
jgi:hypothetical protein